MISIDLLFYFQKPNVTIENNGTFIALDKIVKLTRVMKWCTEIEVLFTGVFTVDYFGDLHSENKMIHSERYTAVVSRLKEINTTVIRRSPCILERNNIFRWRTFSTTPFMQIQRFCNKWKYLFPVKTNSCTICSIH